MTTTSLPGGGPSHHGPAPALLLEDLHKSFGDVHAVRGVDLTLATGGTAALLGPNGAGKSTTVDLLLGLSRPDRGRATVYGLTPREAVQSGTVGAMLQTGGLPPDVRVRDLLRLVASLHEHPLPRDEALARAGAADLVERKVQQLSGGEVQRVRLALAVLPDPRFLVLDEPTAGMDVGARRRFWSTMTDWVRDGRSLLFTTHLLDEADAFADRIVMLRRGRVIADGSAAEVKAMAGLRRITARLDAPDPTALGALPGVVRVGVDGTRIHLACSDSDAALRALLARYPDAHGLDVSGAALEDAFLLLTDDGPDPEPADHLTGGTVR